jgi:hypothetical protein
VLLTLAGIAASDQQQFGEKHRADHKTDRQVVAETFPQFGEIDVEHHDHEQEQDRDGADIDHDQDHRQKFGAHQHEQAGRVDERQDQKQHGVHGIARHNHHHRRSHANAGEQIEEQRGDHANAPL